MAASSGDGIPAQLAALLGHPVKRIRITGETPPRISLIDVATATTGKHVRNAARNAFFVQEKAPRSVSKTEPLPFSRPRSAKHTRDVRYWPHRARNAAPRETGSSCAAPSRGIDVSLPRRRSFPRGRACSPSDSTNDSELDEAMSATGENARRSARRGAPSAEYLSRVCTDIVGRSVPAMIEKLTSYIDERLAHLDIRQVVNLNVRAPKRPASQLPQIAKDITGAGRQFPIAKIID